MAARSDVPKAATYPHPLRLLRFWGPPTPNPLPHGMPASPPTLLGALTVLSTKRVPVEFARRSPFSGRLFSTFLKNVNRA